MARRGTPAMRRPRLRRWTETRVAAEIDPSFLPSTMRIGRCGPSVKGNVAAVNRSRRPRAVSARTGSHADAPDGGDRTGGDQVRAHTRDLGQMTGCADPITDEPEPGALIDGDAVTPRMPRQIHSPGAVLYPGPALPFEPAPPPWRGQIQQGFHAGLGVLQRSSGRHAGADLHRLESGGARPSTAELGRVRNMASSRSTTSEGSSPRRRPTSTIATRRRSGAGAMASPRRRRASRGSTATITGPCSRISASCAASTGEPVSTDTPTARAWSCTTSIKWSSRPVRIGLESAPVGESCGCAPLQTPPRVDPDRDRR